MAHHQHERQHEHQHQSDNTHATRTKQNQPRRSLLSSNIQNTDVWLDNPSHVSAYQCVSGRCSGDAQKTLIGRFAITLPELAEP